MIQVIPNELKISPIFSIWKTVKFFCNIEFMMNFVLVSASSVIYDTNLSFCCSFKP